MVANQWGTGSPAPYRREDYRDRKSYGLLYIPTELKCRIDVEARRRGVALNWLAVQLLERELIVAEREPLT